MENKNILRFGSGAPWESIVGYSRVVRIGPWVEVAGATAVEAGEVLHPADAGAQTRVILHKIKTALEQAGAGLEDVVRTRIFVTRIEDWEAVGRAHGDFFGAIRPVATLVAVNRLVDSEMLVEIKASAYAHAPLPGPHAL